MNVTENHGLRDRFLAGLGERFGGEREGIHVSDLVLCLRESYFRKVSPKAHTATQLMFFLDGAARHRALQEISGVESEVRVERYGIVGSIDMFDDVPIEFKSTRAAKSLPDHYFKQLGYYCILSEKKRGILAVQRLNNRDEPFEFYDVKWSDEELAGLEGEINWRRMTLSDALVTGNPSDLPFTKEEWKCDSCLYAVECNRSDQP